VQLWNPNPQLLGVRWGEATELRWKDRNGHEWKGGLIKPVNYVPGKRYPLVVQMYSFHEGEFLTDGVAPTAMPARAIASAGMFYLQAAKKPRHTWDQQEAQDHLDGVLSAIETLDAQRLIDPHKVGLIGFSFTNWYVENELVRAPGRFAAATIAEGTDNSYTQYLFWGIANPQLRKQMDAINGGEPFGKSLTKWMINAPAFHLDQVTAPVRIEAMTSGSLLGEWEIYASLRLQHKPVDLIYYPTGQHQLQRPLERLASAQGNVDWFRFWLQGYEDPDPAKWQQYTRWERMRCLNEP
jgi:dipeptidyl aminopeptidase/acylaminoacyl peptidase